MKRDADVIVVGSGASAVHAAWPLVERGHRVLMLDVGNAPAGNSAEFPTRDFLDLRHHDPEQHRYFLGERFEGVPFGPVRVGAQLTPPRAFITRDAERLGPVVCKDFFPMQSFALGGLAAGWGASAMPYTDVDLREWPVGREDLQPHYEAVAARIGICGSNHDDLVPFTGEIAGLLPPARLDSNAQAIARAYARRRRALHKRGFHLGRARLAACTIRFRNRGPLRYRDMEFWADPDRAVYRPAWTVEELQRFDRFEYRPGWCVERFDEKKNGNGIKVVARDVESGETATFRAKRLVLGAGAINTARIVLRSLGEYHRPLPLLSNPYTYFPCINVARLGQRTDQHRHSLTQLTMIYDPDGTGEHALQPQMYSYRSLLLFKLLKESPLAHPESCAIMQALCDYFVIVGVFHEDRPRAHNTLRLLPADKPADDWLEIAHRADGALARQHGQQTAGLRRCLRTLGLLPIKSIDPGAGSSIHYAGCLPMQDEGDDVTTTPQCRLRAAPLVAIADGATFPHLPAKGLTYTLMANGNRVGTLLARELER